MTKHTIGIYKAYKNSGNFRFHKDKTKKHWKHYFIEVDDYDEDEITFGSEWVSSLKSIFLKRKQLYKKQIYCTECESLFESYLRKNGKGDDAECPNCD
jgi:hypothetical protein